MTRIAVTGLGVVSALGHRGAGVLGATSSPVRAASGASRSSIRPAISPRWPRKFRDSIRARTSTRPSARCSTAFAQFALVAADEAWKQAGLELDEAGQDRAGVAIGSGMGGVVTQDNRYRSSVRARSDARAPVHDSAHHEQRGGLAREHATRTARPGTLDRQRVRGGGTRDWRSGRDHSRRPRRRHGGRRRRRADRARRRPMLGSDARPGADAERRSLARVPAVQPRSDREWCLAKAPASWCSSRGSTRRRAARKFSPSSPGTARPPTPDT